MSRTAPTARSVAVAGHVGDEVGAREGLASTDPSVRATALGALERMDALQDVMLIDALSDSDAAVRRRAAEVAATHPRCDLAGALDDADHPVAEVAAWSCGEHEDDRPEIVDRLISLAGTAADALVRESAVAALGAIGSERGLPAILAAMVYGGGLCWRSRHSTGPTSRQRSIGRSSTGTGRYVKRPKTCAAPPRDGEPSGTFLASCLSGFDGPFQVSSK